jgi:hypothetical protein
MALFVIGLGARAAEEKGFGGDLRQLPIDRQLHRFTPFFSERAGWVVSKGAKRGTGREFVM